VQEGADIHVSIRTSTLLLLLGLAIVPSTIGAQQSKEDDMDAVRVRYMVNDIDAAVSFYTKYLGFAAKPGATPNFAMLTRGHLELVLSTPFGPGGAAKPMADGRKAAPGGWNRIIINVDNLQSEVDRLRHAQLHFRSDILKGPGGSEILLDDPSGNPVELFQPAAR
jgi:catechol 2,3-dioxygenase-like lactoylglutathione lyase family enzyme